MLRGRCGIAVDGVRLTDGITDRPYRSQTNRTTEWVSAERSSPS